jgi:hypothetical protein
MSAAAPLCVPAEIRRHGGDPRSPRWFRLAIAMSEEGILLRSPVPEELCQGPLAIRLHLPEDRDPAELARHPELAGPLELVGLAGEVVVDEGEETERAQWRLVHLRGVTEATRDRIADYVKRRLASDKDAG